MTELDDLLRSSLQRLAEPGDTAGVLDAIRAKLDAAGPAGPGGGGASGMSGLAGTGIVVAVAIGASALGAGLGWSAGGTQATTPSATPAAVQAAPMHGVPAAACPGGAAVTELDPGARVLALARSEDGAYLAVRDPASLGTLVWVAADAAVVDPGQDVLGLEVRSCADGSPIPASPSPEPTPAPEPTPTPAPDPGPAPAPKDTAAPVIDAGGWSSTVIYGADWGPACSPSTATIVVTASDDIGVTQVTAVTNFAGLTPVLQSHSGNTWVFAIATPSGGQPSPGADVPVIATFTAFDASGKTAADTASFTYYYCLL